MRAEVASVGYGLEELVKDPDETVRAAVAEMGKFLDVLVDDPSVEVRATVANQKYGFEKLINDKYCKDLTEEQKELARKCTEPLLDKGIELYECGLQSFVSTLKG